MVLQPAGFTAACFSEKSAGSDSWWDKIAETGSPVVERQNNDHRLKLTFFWRDPQGNETTSSFRRVFLDINGVTNHHSFSPESLERVPGTDIWAATIRMAGDWRGSYSLIPVTESQLPPQPCGTPEQQQIQQREWWCSLFPFTIADPLNPVKPHSNSQGISLSAVHLPDANKQKAWNDVDLGIARFIDENDFLLEWKSPRLGNTRHTWIWQPEGAQRMILPLVILPDGKKWLKEMTLLPVLEKQTRLGILPKAVWLMIDSIDGVTRSHELPCNADFWLAVQEELLPLVRQHVSFTDAPSATIVAGQSYGGLSALYAALFWPERFGCVLTQSGSFWWPNMRFMTHYEEREKHEKGFLTQQIAQSKDIAPLRIFQEVGLLEQDIHFVNQQMYQVLLEAGHEINYRVYHGGHDALCWRGGLIDGVCWLLGHCRVTEFDADKEKR